ncbi:MAG TPA: response regulator transcription factor [Cellulomonadaceae bacterium]|nr:response regulator transcription factor [Cellulomonadaceae bacterium]
MAAREATTAPSPSVGTRYRALVVDDEPAFVRVVAAYLARDGFEVDTATDGTEALRLAAAGHPDVVVLDVMMPGVDGVEVCRRLRTFSDAYVLMLTARAEEIDVLVGLSVGADDYLTKPFSSRVLVARIRSMLRRPRTAGDTAGRAQDVSAEPPHRPPRRFGALEINTEAREVTVEGRSVSLTPLEFDLLAVLSSRPGTAFSRARLREEVWGPGWFGDDRVVAIHIGHLRRKLGDDVTEPRYIRTVRGVGYRMASG